VFSARVKSSAATAKRFSGAEVRREMASAVPAIAPFIELMTSLWLMGQSQLSFRVRNEELLLSESIKVEDGEESKDPDGATSWCAIVIEPV
jgi:hypothetical protein